MSSFYANQPVDTNKRLEKRFKEREDEYITYRQFHVLVGTFNVNNRQASNNQHLDEWLHRQIEKNIDTFPDIIAVGFQEIDTSGGAYVYDDKKKEDEWEQAVRKAIQSSYHSKDEKKRFQLLNRVRLMGILLFVYVRGTHMSHCTQISRASVATGFMGIAGNKGGVGVSFRCYETDICFVNCHFASGDGQTQRRNDDYQAIESRMVFSDAPNYSLKDYVWYIAAGTGGTASNSSAPVANRCWKINDHDIVFWFGDMNYRISQPNEQVRKAISELSTVPLHEKDQLRCEMKLNNVFANYSEPAIDFMPTYKFDPKTDNYDTSDKLRTPSWTDRILYHAKRPKVRQIDQSELEAIHPIDYSCAKNIRFSDHRPVSGLYLVAMKFERDEKSASRIRDDLIRQMDREENDSIPTIEVHPRAPAIVFDNLRYLDKMSYSLTIRNVGECSCSFTLCPPSLFRPTNPIKGKPTSEEPFFECLSLTPNPPYYLEPQQEQTIQISFKMKTEYAWLFGTQLNEILILHVENGADTFITLDITLEMGPFGLAFNQFPPTLYNSRSKQYVYSLEQSPDLMEMKNDPPALYIALIECLKARQDINLLQVFSNDVQDTIDLLPIRNQIYQHNYDFEHFPSGQIFLILLHLLQALPEPLIARDIQDRIFPSNASARSVNMPSGGSIQSHIPADHHPVSPPQDMTKAVAIIIEQLKPKERNFFFRFLSFIQKSWPAADQIKRFSHDQRSTMNIVIDILSMSILHEHADREQRHAFLLACLNEEKKKHSK